MGCTGLAENTGRKKSPKIRHLGTIAQLCRAISLQLRHVSTIGKKLLNSNISPTCRSQYGELRPTNGWDRFGCFGHRSKFQRVSRLGIVTTRHSIIGRQPNFAALRRGRHLYSARRPSRLALAHILVKIILWWIDGTTRYSIFYRATQLCLRGLGSRNSVRPSVCPSVCLSHACYVTNPKNLPAIFFIPNERAILLVFWCQRYRRNSTGSPPTGAPNSGGVG